MRERESKSEGRWGGRGGEERQEGERRGGWEGRQEGEMRWERREGEGRRGEGRQEGERRGWEGER